MVGEMMDFFWNCCSFWYFPYEEIQSGISIQNMKFNLTFSAEFPCSHDQKEQEFRNKIISFSTLFQTIHTLPPIKPALEVVIILVFLWKKIHLFWQNLYYFSDHRWLPVLDNKWEKSPNLTPCLYLYEYMTFGYIKK